MNSSAAEFCSADEPESPGPSDRSEYGVLRFIRAQGFKFWAPRHSVLQDTRERRWPQVFGNLLGWLRRIRDEHGQDNVYT